jgi:hypothetical protein
VEKSQSKNMELVAYHDLNNRPGFQMAIQSVKNRWYLYVAHWKAQGFTIMDVTEPEKPKFVKFVPEPLGKPGTQVNKIQVADGILMSNLGQYNVFYHGIDPKLAYDGGVMFWDVKDPENPKMLSWWDFGGGGRGTHRNYWAGGRYAYLSSSCRGFDGFILRILDIIDPSHPVEVGRWWMPEQYQAGGAKMRPGVKIHLHGPPYPNKKGDRLYVSYAGHGLVILDISDITLPRYIGSLQTHPPFGWAAPPIHTVLPIEKRKLAIMTSEGRRVPTMPQGSKQTGKIPPMNFIGVADISDEKDPSLISVFPVPEPPPGSPFKNYQETERMGAFGFGPHNLHEPHYHPDMEDRDDRIYCAYCSAGVRVYDINDPFMPKEIAYYVPPDPQDWAWQKIGGFKGDLRTNVEDIIVDRRGYIFVDDMQQGLFVLRCTV